VLVDQRRVFLTRLSGARSPVQPISLSLDTSTRLSHRVVFYSVGVLLDLNVRSDRSPNNSPFFLLLSGDEGIRTPDLRNANAALSQLSYIPRHFWVVGLSGLEPETLPLSEARSNQLS
jgi:hypothetical protein